MKKWLVFLLAILFFMVIHEGAHALLAAIFGEYGAFHIKPIGMEVTYKTPVDERSGFHWALIAGMSNLLTIAMGYLLLSLGGRFSHLNNVFLKAGVYYLTLISLLLDPINLSIGPFIYGGDAPGVAEGLGVNLIVVQIVFFIVFLVNREVIAQKLLPMYDVTTEYILLRPWFRLKN